MPFAILETIPNGESRFIATEETLFAAIVHALDDESLDTVDLWKLQRVHVPDARLKAANSESRTRPVRLAEKTTVVSAAQIRREHVAAVEAEVNRTEEPPESEKLGIIDKGANREPGANDPQQ